ncbi:hypothetical protein ABPG72_019550 [Tetrahymena utriculariae]
MKQFQKISILLILASIFNLVEYVKSDIIYNDTIQYIEYGTALQLKVFQGVNQQQTSNNLTINYFNFKNTFKAPPSILVGINRYDNQFNQSKINFQIQKNTSQNNFKISLTIFSGTILNGLYINYLAIDTNQYNFTFISDILTQPVVMQQNNNFYNYNFYVQFQLPPVQGQIQKKVQAFLTGFEALNQTINQYDKFSIYFEVTSQNLTGFNITVSQQTGSFQIQTVYYNFIEINEDPYGTLETDLLNYNQLEDTSLFPCFNDPSQYTTCDYPLADKKNQYNRSLSLSIPLNHPISQTNIPNVNLFTGLNTFTVLNKYNDYALANPRLQIGNYLVINQNISISYYVWYNTTVSSISSQGIAIFLKSCDQNSEILNKNTCILSSDNCNIGTYLNQNANICSLCDSSCLTCQDQAKKCISCQKGYYLFQQQCQNSKPKNYYCDEQSNQSYICTQQCLDQYCENCSSQSKNSCTACSQSYYLFQNLCQQQQPPQTYCNNYNCTKCIDTNCQDCSQISEQICDKCIDNFYLFNDKCYESQPDSTYCDQDKICIPCITPNQTLQKLSDYTIQLYFIFSLPFLVTNFHPFSDAYIYTLQLIGNFGIVSSKQHISQAFLVPFRNQKNTSHHFDMFYQSKNQPISFTNNFFNNISDFRKLQTLQVNKRNKDVTNNLDISLKDLGRSRAFTNNPMKISNLLITPRQTLKI